MSNNLELTIGQAESKIKTLRFCIRCNHMERACSCKEPVWVSRQTAQGKGISELRKLQFKKVRTAFPKSEAVK